MLPFPSEVLLSLLLSKQGDGGKLHVSSTLRNESVAWKKGEEIPDGSLVRKQVWDWEDQEPVSAGKWKSKQNHRKILFPPPKCVTLWRQNIYLSDRKMHCVFMYVEKIEITRAFVAYRNKKREKKLHIFPWVSLNLILSLKTHFSLSYKAVYHTSHNKGVSMC